MGALENVTSAEDLDELSCGGQSFTPGTGVLLADRKTVPIADLKPGDKVPGTNTSTGKTQTEPVTAVLVHYDTDLYDLTVTTSHGTAVIHTTSSHLFWVPGTGGHGGQWVKAGLCGMAPASARPAAGTLPSAAAGLPGPPSAGCGTCPFPAAATTTSISTS